MGLPIIHAIPWAVCLVALFLCAATDLRDRIIPNELVALVAACGLVLGLASRPGEVWISLLAALGVLVGLGVLAHFDLVGGGDVKLISALTLMVPPQGIGSLLVAIILAGGVLGCIYYVARRRIALRAAPQGDPPAPERPGGRLDRLLRQERARILGDEPMPYGLAILGGAVSYIARELPQCLSAISCSL